jgi:hypothetical protein
MKKRLIALTLILSAASVFAQGHLNGSGNGSVDMPIGEDALYLQQF